MKVVFSDISLRDKVEAVDYKNTGNYKLTKSLKVKYPVNAVLAEKLHKDDEVKIVLMITKALDEKKVSWTKKNVEDFKSELDAINKDIGAKITYTSIESDFEGTREVFEKLYRDMIGMLVPDCEVYADITFGPRLTPMLILSVMNFAEHFYNADLKGIFYGKVEHTEDENGKKILKNQAIFDVSGVYYLNNLTNSLQAESADKAIKTLDILLKE